MTLGDATLDGFVSSLTPAALDRTTVSERRKILEGTLREKTNFSSLFESGSWSHGTSVSGHSDVDYMALAPARARPTLPSSALRTLSDAISGSHWSISSLRISTPAVKVSFYQSPNVELAPAFFHRQVSGVDVYHIPGPGNEWIESIPQGHNTYVSDVNDRLGKKLKPLVRLIKSWKYAQSVPVSSFYLEMRTASYASGESSIINDIDLRSMFRQLIAGEMRAMNDPLGIVGRIPATSSDANRTSALRSAKLASEHLQAADEALVAGDSARYWRNMSAVFGLQYPYPSW